MNTIRHLLVHVDDERLAAQALALGVALAREHGAAMTALLAFERAKPGVFFSAEAASLAVRADEQRLQTLSDRVRALVAATAAQAGLDIALLQADDEPVDSLIRASRGADLVLVSQREAESVAGLDPAAASQLLLSAGCPLLFVPHIGWASPLRRLLVGWSDTRECARALRDALPLLQRAEHVELVHFVDDGDADLTLPQPVPDALRVSARFLEHHGVQPVLTVRHSHEPSLGERLRRPWTPDASVAEALLSHAADVAADGLVMGGYGHSRAWELVMGGVTQTLLESMTVPVFMAH